MTIMQRINVWLGLSYKCRCGAIIPIGSKEFHEEVHTKLSEFFQAPTMQDIHGFVKE